MQRYIQDVPGSLIDAAARAKEAGNLPSAYRLEMQAAHVAMGDRLSQSCRDRAKSLVEGMSKADYDEIIADGPNVHEKDHRLFGAEFNFSDQLVAGIMRTLKHQLQFTESLLMADLIGINRTTDVANGDTSNLVEVMVQLEDQDREYGMATIRIYNSDTGYKDSIKVHAMEYHWATSKHRGAVVRSIADAFASAR